MTSIWHYWGKARPDDASRARYHLLPYHCLDVAAVGVAYLRAVPHLRQWFMQALGLTDDDALLAWVMFWLALHDLGKFSESFQSQRADVFEELRHRAPTPGKAYDVRHDTLGQAAWRELLEDQAIADAWLGADTEDNLGGLRAWVRAVTGHHGQPPRHDAYFCRHFDPADDREAILEFTARIKALAFGTTGLLQPLPADHDVFQCASERLSWWVAGLAVLADWIGSNTDFFPYRDRAPADGELADYWSEAQERAQIALAATGVLPNPRPGALPFHGLFPHIAQPSPLQAWAGQCEVAHGPALYLLEDVTGAGKTEAALLLAHRLMAAGAADGFFIGLPTMATANAMYGRVTEVFAGLFGPEASLALAHGRSRLVEAFATTVLPSGPAEHDATQVDETATARCTAWLADHNKRALLAAGGVGTIDQALLGVLHSKHQSLRLLGLFRKVLIVDEVHACDSYMQRVLESLLEFHAYAGGSVVLLSATLPLAMKQALLKAYVRGRRHAGATALAEPRLQAPHYPLATTWHEHLAGAVQEEPLPSRPEVCRSVDLRYLSDLSAVHAQIEQALAQGRCVCWMRNSVADALDAYAELKARLGGDTITLFHARFCLHDRLAIEDRVLHRFGKHSDAARRRGQLVIATQVVEQSLDADWDVVISDLAPIDRLIQRAGRLLRHVRDASGNRLHEPGAQDQRGTPCLWVYGPAWTEAPQPGWFKSVFPRAAAVYPHHGQLWLTAKAMQARHFAMPADARALIESVFGDEAAVPAGLAANANRAEGTASAERSQGGANVVKLAHGYVRGDVIDWWSEAKTPSRLGEASTTVVLARWAGEELVPWVPHDNLSRAWAYSSLRVPERLIAARAPEASEVREAALRAAEEQMPGGGKWSVLLPLEIKAERWGGWARAQRGNTHEPLLRLEYSACEGLLEAQDRGEDLPE
jgi:CRISPR-associated endonuclease/helicase Cas3